MGRHEYKIEHRTGYRYDEYVVWHKYPKAGDFTEVVRYSYEEQATALVRDLKKVDRLPEAIDWMNSND